MSTRSRAGKHQGYLRVMTPGKRGGESEGAERRVEVNCRLQSFQSPGLSGSSLAPMDGLLTGWVGALGGAIRENGLELGRAVWGCCRGFLDN